MIANAIISFVIWIYQNTLLRVLPTDLPFFSYSAYNTMLASIQNNLLVPLSAVNNVFPVDTMLLIFGAILSAELILFAVKIGTFIINIFRGAGA
jgi:hypothetical protein